MESNVKDGGVKGVRTGGEHGTFCIREVRESLGNGAQWKGVVRHQFRKLEKSGILVCMMDEADRDFAEAEKVRYRFQSEWMRESIANRLTNSQKEKLWNVMDRIAEDKAQELIEETLDHITPEMENMEGWLNVKKKESRGSKKRYCVLVHGEVREYEKQDKKILKEVICLDSTRARIYSVDGAETVFVIETDRWYKQKSNKLETSFREYEFTVETAPDLKQWLMRCQLQITKMKKK
mmetsp:Transcript_4162/g.4860  ORF Transcript_4162/g.4860 Transcript_4162/m.4860 type:complete len:236 (+) Transcript_4162:722-1429(+)